MTPETHEFEGKDVSEAIANACAALATTQEKLNVEIITPGSAGFLGLGKRKARIRVSLKERKKGGARPPRTREADATISPEVADNLKNTLEKILLLMDMESRVELNISGNRIDARISGDHVDAITERDGSVLDSLQYLMRKIVSRNVTGKAIFNLDAGNYREQRRRELEEKAVRLAAETRETGRTRAIGSLNPAERRIVHLALQDETEIRSRSVGDGHFKKVLIYVPGRGKSRRRKRN